MLPSPQNPLWKDGEHLCICSTYDFASMQPVDPTAPSHTAAAFDVEFVARVIFNLSQTREAFVSSCVVV